MAKLLSSARRLLAATLLAAAAGVGSAYATPLLPNSVYTLSGTFGTTYTLGGGVGYTATTAGKLSGSFRTDASGAVIDNFLVVTTNSTSGVNPPYGGSNYFRNVVGNAALTVIDINNYGPTTGADIHLVFDAPLGYGLNTADAVLSFECKGYANCGSSNYPVDNGGDTFRSFASATVFVPEPASLAVLGAGLVGLLAIRRRART